MFAKNISRLRKQKKKTQLEMANILGVAKTTYASYEQDRRMPDVNTQNRIADYFNVTLDALHGREEIKSAEPEALMFNSLDGFSELSPEEQKRIEDTLIEQALFMIERAKNK